MTLLPVVLNLRERRCLVVGGGNVALRKTQSLLDCHARVHIVAPQLCEGFESLRARFEYSNRGFQSGDCRGHEIVFACTDRREVNAQIAAEARENNIWCNIADDPQHSDFHTTATVRRGDVSIGVATNGHPVLAQHLKARVAECIGDEYAQLLEIVNERQAAQQAAMPKAERGDFWRALLQSEALFLLRDGQRERAEKLVADLLK